MAVDLSCYVSGKKNEVEEEIKLFADQHQELFPKKFIISGIREAGAIHKEIALEYGLNAQSVFLISLNDKSAAGLVLNVASMLKSVIGESNIVILHGNEKLI